MKKGRHETRGRTDAAGALRRAAFFVFSGALAAAWAAALLGVALSIAGKLTPAYFAVIMRAAACGAVIGGIFGGATAWRK